MRFAHNLRRFGGMRRASSGVAPPRVHQFPARDDNYFYLIHDPNSGETACVDTPDAARVNVALKALNYTLTTILNTHHHDDHTAGNEALKAEWGANIIGPGREGSIPGMDHGVREGDSFKVGKAAFQVLETPGHTLTGITFYLESASAAFVGDTLFSMGCGRLFEGTPEMMHASIQKLMHLPEETLLWTGHQYFASNAKFALSVDSSNKDILARVANFDDVFDRIDSFSQVSECPLDVTTVANEKATNPFCRTQSPEIRACLGMDCNASDEEVFGELRRRKDVF